METLSQFFSAKIKSFEKINDQLTRCRCYVMALGKNRNMSYFDEDTVMSALPTLYNAPVIGHLCEDEDGNLYMGGHDMELVIDDKGIELKSLCVPFGVVPIQDNITFEDVLEPNGRITKYLVADVILWTGRYPELHDAVYSDEIYFNQSMEILPVSQQPLDEDPNYRHITEFTFSALCMLGKDDDVMSEKHTEPCFPASRIEPCKFALDNEFTELMEQLKFELSQCSAETKPKGSEVTMPMTEERIRDIFAEFAIEYDEEIFEITEETTEEELRDMLAAYEPAPASTPEPEAKEVSFAASYEERRTAIAGALSPVVIKDSEGRFVSETRDYLVDFDDEYAFVMRYTFTAEDYEEQPGRMTYSYNEEERAASITGEFEQMVVKWLTLDENDKIERWREEFDALVQFRDERLQEDHRANVDAILNQFEDIANNEEFIQLRESAYEIQDLDELETKCHVIRSKNFKANIVPPANGNGRVPIERNIDNEVYGGWFAHFGIKPQNK